MNLLKTTFISALAGICLLLAPGCSSTPSKVDTGVIRARSFSFVSIKGRPAPEFADQREHIHALVQNAITDSLARRQVARLPEGGDVTVAYLIITGNSAVTETISDYFGYGRDSSKLSERAHAAYTSSKNPNYFEAGTLLIDIIDTKSWKLLKRGYATRMLLDNPTPEAQRARISEAVEEILSGVRFKP